ncbi:MAG TPA: hypothetical protein VFW33_08920 [Gemmataceae bacterium]|nr:hypothetical protein [Gemmataceae bacterium]
MLRNLWQDDGGSTLVTSEILFIFAILALGIITGLVALRQALISELTESAQALLAINQSFSFSGQSNCESFTLGSSAGDTTNTIGEGGVGVFGGNAGVISQVPCD